MKEIVIKIPDETLYVLMEHDWSDKKIVTEEALKTLENAFFDAKMLPKGHDRLIDAKAYENDIRKHYFDNDTVIRCTEIALSCADTLVEADKGDPE